MKNIMFVLKSRRPHIQLPGSDFNGRQFTTQCEVLPLRQYYYFQRNWKQMTPLPFVSTSEHPTSSARWDDMGFCGHILWFSYFSWPALYPRQSRQLHQTQWFLAQRGDLV